MVSLDARSIILEVSEKFKLKKDKIEPPEVYPEGRISKNSLNGQEIMYYFKRELLQGNY